MAWRLWAIIVWAACGLGTAWAAPPTFHVTPESRPLNLAAWIDATRATIAAPDAPMDPDAMWALPDGTRNPNAEAWELTGGERWIGRATVIGVREGQDYVFQVPMPQVDHAHLWWRIGRGEWQHARAGDRVPLSQWPFANPFPAFSIDVGADPVDVILTVENAAYLRVPVTLMPDPQFRENLVQRANLSGMIMGLGAMVTLVCLLGALAYRERSHWVLAGVSAWVLLSVAANNGYLTIWFTGDWPAFNDWSRSITAVILIGFMVLLCTEALDPLHLKRRERLIGIAAPLVAAVYAVVQLTLLPLAWRVQGALLLTVIFLLACGALCAVNALRGGRHVSWVSGAVIALLFAPVVVAAGPDQVSGLDLRAAAVGVCMYTGLLLFRHTLMVRDRYGRDVLGREAIGTSRDPLTALWSYEGFEQRHAEAALREAAGQGTASVMMLAVPGLDEAAIEHGSTVAERTLVRFAALLHRLLGQRWALARVSRTRFAAISLRPITSRELGEAATQVLAHCVRVQQPFDLVATFDLRIACSRRRLADLSMAELLRDMRNAALALNGRKRIVYMQPTAMSSLGSIGAEVETAEA
ncbi:MAG: 7TM diverse intracellular signaling domain-containing protein [Ramlibacter sp.]